MLMCYGEARGNASLALRLYQSRYPDARHPRDSRVITRAYQRILDNQPVVPVQEGSGRPIRNRVEETILDLVQRNPRLGTRTAARMLRRRGHGSRLSHWTVHRVLRRDRQRAYHIHKVQALVPGDRQRRVAYCRWLLDQQRRNAAFVSHVIWTDESTFTRNGMWNRRNEHIWSHHNPYAIQETGHQTRWSVNVWAGIYNNKIIGPVFLADRMNGPGYLNFLENALENEMQDLRTELDQEREELDQNEDLPLARYPTMWFQHDGAPPHVTLPVRQHLDRTFPGRWIGRFGPHLWPARSPDLTPLDFFLWGFVKERVFSTQCETAEEMRVRITGAFEQLRRDIEQDPTLMPRLHDETLRRALICERLGGGQFEPYLIRRESL